MKQRTLIFVIAGAIALVGIAAIFVFSTSGAPNKSDATRQFTVRGQSAFPHNQVTEVYDNGMSLDPTHYRVFFKTTVTKIPSDPLSHDNLTEDCAVDFAKTESGWLMLENGVSCQITSGS